MGEEGGSGRAIVGLGLSQICLPLPNLIPQGSGFNGYGTKSRYPWGLDGQRSGSDPAPFHLVAGVGFEPTDSGL